MFIFTAINKIECPDCQGWGWLNGSVADTCPTCGGLGSVDDK